MTTVHFINNIFGNYLDNYYTDRYEELMDTLVVNKSFTASVNLGFVDGVIIMNTFVGDFTKVNCAVVIHEIQGRHLYKIIKKEFIRRNLWRVTMVKDMVSSNFLSIKSSDVLVSRIGISRQEFDPILFTPEEMTLSEVKKRQIMLDQFGTEFKSYGYMLFWARDSIKDGQVKIKTTITSDIQADMTVDVITNFYGYEKKFNVSYYLSQMFKIGRKENSIYDRLPMSQILRYNNIKETNNLPQYKDWTISPSTQYYWESCDFYIIQDKYIPFINSDLEQLGNAFAYSTDSAIRSKLGFDACNNTYNNLLTLVGKTIFETSTGKLRKIKLKYEKKIETILIPKETLMHYIRNQLPYPQQSDVGSNIAGDNISINITVDKYSLDYDIIETIDVNADKILSNFQNAIDQPFQLMFIPVIEDIYQNGPSKKFDKQYIEGIINALIRDYGGENPKLLDVQMVPINPVRGFKNGFDRDIFFIEDVDQQPIDKIITDNTEVYIFNILKASFNGSIKIDINIDDYKIEQKKRYQLTSPSGATLYDFSLAKNNGLHGILYDVDYRPFASYYHYRPIYSSLYGENFVDTRGLIFTEDMSLTQISSAWETYKRQNVNYQNSFNAEVSYKTSVYNINSETNWGNYGFDAGKRIIEAGVEAATTAAETTAADVWGVKGGAAGAGAAAAIMGGAIAMEGIEAGQVAYNINQEGKMLANDIDYSRKQFTYNLSNIKALPENLSKVSGIYNTNNFIPYIQVFEPTDTEIERYNKYLDLYGVNCGQIINLNTRNFNYLQGVILKYSSSISNQEYQEMQTQLKRGVRKYEFVSI